MILARSLAGYRARFLLPDAVAGLTLAAVAVPEQLATARLAGLPPQYGFFAFIAGTFGFALLGSSRFLSVGADSTIAPIFAAALAAAAATGSPQYLVLAAMLALMVGALALVAGLIRMGWIADLLSAPVTIGFLAGVSIHIIVSQLPGALGVAATGGSLVHRLTALAGAAGGLNPYAFAIAAGVLALTALAHRLSLRLPGALAAMTLASGATALLRLDAKGVAVLGHVPAGFPSSPLAEINLGALVRLAPLALLIALVAMVQTAATSRGFPEDPDGSVDVERDYIGLGAGNLLAGLIGAFPVNASPPRTAIAAEGGARSQFAGLVAVGIVVLVVAFGEGLLAFVPVAALSGVLIFIALRIIRARQIAAVAAASPVELALILATVAAIVALPIETGVAVGVALSLLHGTWSSARPRTFRMERIPGTTIWWPKDRAGAGETEPAVAVVGFQAPLFFLNAYEFRRQLTAPLGESPPAELIVLEAAGILDIDFTGAQVFASVVARCRAAGATLAVARLESVRAQSAFVRLGLAELIGEDHVFESVSEAVATLRPH
ncbi:MAG: SulP family inorganic anion transporter [Caulobacteraceae bacterium]